MERFRCAACGTAFTGPLRRVPLPAPIEPAELSHCLPNPALIERGSYAVDPRAYGRAAQTGMYVLHPADVRATSLVPNRCVTGCWSVVGFPGPNEACDGCGTLVGHRTDDCERAQERRLDPDAVVIEACDSGVPVPPEPFRWAGTWIAGEAEHTELFRTRWRRAQLARDLLRDDPPGRPDSVH